MTMTVRAPRSRPCSSSGPIRPGSSAARRRSTYVGSSETIPTPDASTASGASRPRRSKAQASGATGSQGASSGGGDCAPGYDSCLDADASDYDCEGGTGDGPKYTGRVEVSGDDPFDLDRDGNGVGCE